MAPPIQEDETASVLFAFTQYYHSHPSTELLDEFYHTLIKPVSDFMCQYVDETTHLPRPTYDLWEETFITSTYTTAVVHAVLLAAAELADIRHDDTSAVKWRAAAEDMQAAATKYLFDSERKLLRKGILAHEDGEIDYYNTLDISSFYGCFMYGLFPASSQEIVSTKDAIMSIILGESSTFPGLPRYENDGYLRQNGKGPNPWFICSLWLAQYHIELGNIDDAAIILRWVEERATVTYHLSEQVDKDDKRQLSVSPLVWSHAEYMATLLDTIAEPQQ